MPVYWSHQHNIMYGSAETQCPKLRFYFVHPPGALLLKLCIRDFLHALFYYVVMILSKKRAHSECTPPKIVHPAAEICAPGAGCTLNFGH